MSVKWRPEVDVRKGIVVNLKGALVYDMPRNDSKVIDTKGYGSQIEYTTMNHLSWLTDNGLFISLAMIIISDILKKMI